MNGARHQTPFLSLSNTATSSSCAVRKASPDPAAIRHVTSGPNSPAICVPTMEQITPTTKPATTTFLAMAAPVELVHHVCHQECQRIGERAPCQPLTKQELHKDVGCHDDCGHADDAGQNAGHVMNPFLQGLRRLGSRWRERRANIVRMPEGQATPDRQPGKNCSRSGPVRGIGERPAARLTVSASALSRTDPAGRRGTYSTRGFGGRRVRIRRRRVENVP